jgi:Ketosteroid isomerase homolog
MTDQYMAHTDIAIMEAASIGDRDVEIIAAEAQLRSAQLSADTNALSQLISDDLLFTGPDGQLATKAQDLESYGSGAVRFRQHQPEELRIRRIGSNVAISSLSARLAVEIGGKVVNGVYRYTRVWSREGGRWKVAGGHVSQVLG